MMSKQNQDVGESADDSIALIATVFNCLDEAKLGLEFFLKPRNVSQVNEIVIVDGGSTDGTWQYLESCAQRETKLHVYRVPGANISRGRNEAIRRSDAALIVCFDSGTEYSENWLSLMVEPLRGGADVVGGKSNPIGKTPEEKCWASFWHNTLGHDNVSHRAIAYRKTVWEAIGGYPEYVAAGEDTWFNRKYQDLGFRYVYQSEAECFWRVRTSFLALFKMTLRNTTGHVVLRGNSNTGRLYLLLCAKVLYLVTLTAGLFYWPLLIIATGMYALYTWRRALDRGRWRFFKSPRLFCFAVVSMEVRDAAAFCGVMSGTWQRLRHCSRDDVLTGG